MIRTLFFFLAFVTAAPVLVYSQPGGGQQAVTSITKVTLYHNNVAGVENADRIYNCVVGNSIGFVTESFCKNTSSEAVEYRLKWTWYRYKWSGSAQTSKVMVEYGTGGFSPLVTVQGNGETTFVTEQKTAGTFTPDLDEYVTVSLKLQSRPVGNNGLWLDDDARSGHYHQGAAPPGGPGQ